MFVRFMPLLGLLSFSCSFGENSSTPPSSVADSVVYMYNDYLDKPKDVYRGGWSKPSREHGMITQSYTQHGKDIIRNHYIFTYKGDTISADQFRQLGERVRKYDTLFAEMRQKGQAFLGENIITRNERTTYYMLWPTDSTRSSYGCAKVMEWTYYHGVDVNCSVLTID